MILQAGLPSCNMSEGMENMEISDPHLPGPLPAQPKPIMRPEEISKKNGGVTLSVIPGGVEYDIAGFRFRLDSPAHGDILCCARAISDQMVKVSGM